MKNKQKWHVYNNLEHSVLEAKQLARFEHCTSFLLVFGVFHARPSNVRVIAVGWKTKGATGDQLFQLKTCRDKYRRTYPDLWAECVCLLVHHNQRTNK